MTTRCHKTGHYLFEQWAGALLFRYVGRRKVYTGQCSRCGRKHDLTEKESRTALRENINA